MRNREEEVWKEGREGGRMEGKKERSCELVVMLRINVQMLTFGTVDFSVSVFYFFFFCLFVSNYSLFAHVVCPR